MAWASLPGGAGQYPTVQCEGALLASELAFSLCQWFVNGITVLSIVLAASLNPLPMLPAAPPPPHANLGQASPNYPFPGPKLCRRDVGSAGLILLCLPGVNGTRWVTGTTQERCSCQSGENQTQGLNCYVVPKGRMDGAQPDAAGAAAAQRQLD